MAGPTLCGFSIPQQYLEHWINQQKATKEGQVSKQGLTSPEGQWMQPQTLWTEGKGLQPTEYFRTWRGPRYHHGRNSPNETAADPKDPLDVNVMKCETTKVPFRFTSMKSNWRQYHSQRMWLPKTHKGPSVRPGKGRPQSSHSTDLYTQRWQFLIPSN